MNKNDFTNELKELISSMSEEEIEKTINALSGCKAAVYKKNNQEKCEMARHFSAVKRREAELQYVGKGKKEGIINVIGATTLTTNDFELLHSAIPGCNDSWWLRDKSLISNGSRTRFYDNKTTGKIRPVLIIGMIRGDLKAGESFYVNNEIFKLLTSYIAVKTACLEDSCTYNAEHYEYSILEYCVDGWYMKLIHDNNKQKRQSTSRT